MKWLKIKKYLKIFSVIICSIFVFSNKTYAYEFKFDGKSYNTDNFRNALNDYYPEYFENDQFDNYVELVWHKDNEIKYILVPISFRAEGDGETYLPNYFYNLTDYSIITDIDYITNLNNRSNIVVGAAQKNDGTDYSGYQLFIGDYINNLWILELNIDKTTGDYRYYNTTLYNLNSSIVKNFRDYYIYCNYNLNFLFNSELDTSYIEIPSSIENPLKYRMQFNNDVSPDLKQITFDFSSWEYTEGSNPVKSKIEIGNWNNTSNLANYLTQNIMGHGIDGIEYDVNEYFDVQIETVDYLTTKELTFTYNLKKELPENILRIKVYYDFETFDDNYFFNVFDNTSWGSPDWRYIENFLVGYKKYTFPDGYDLAIIRSKNFQDLKSFYISDKLYFTSPEYGYELKNYDFINKSTTYIFNSLTQYLFNPVYLKIPLVIDETNNIFPVLTKPLNTEKGVFYLKDDLFVQFVNSDTLESIVENIPDDEFNQKNDLILGGDISNIKPIEINKEESLYQFFAGFWEKFNYFSDIFSYITACFTEFFFSLPSTIQFFLSASFAFIIFKLITYLIL